MGRRTVRQIAADRTTDAVIAIDRVAVGRTVAKVKSVRHDVLEPGLAELLTGASALVHLADVDGRRDDPALALRLLDNVLAAAAAAGVGHVTVLSSAMVYGAHADNPVPLPETHPLRPNPGFDFAQAKHQVEARAAAWAEASGAALCMVRPTTTLSESGSSWVAASLRAALAVRPDQIDPPVQFLHHDDLASALSLIARRQIAGPVNVAPDGWIGTEIFRELTGGPPVRLPKALSRQVATAGRRVGIGTGPDGIEPYVQHPWVVANDRLRSEGWVPAFSNEEAFVAGTPAPFWAVSAQRRQELALAAAGAGMAGAAAVAGALAKRLSR